MTKGLDEKSDRAPLGRQRHPEGKTTSKAVGETRKLIQQQQGNTYCKFILPIIFRVWQEGCKSFQGQSVTVGG